MKLLEISDDEREAKRGFHSLAVDNDGNEVLVGLTRSESEWMIAYERAHGFGSPNRSRSSQADRSKHVELNKRHGASRLLALGRDTAGIKLN